MYKVSHCFLHDFPCDILAQLQRVAPPVCGVQNLPPDSESTCLKGKISLLF